jgi:hypothetical protein
MALRKVRIVASRMIASKCEEARRSLYARDPGLIIAKRNLERASSAVNRVYLTKATADNPRMLARESKS